MNNKTSRYLPLTTVLTWLAVGLLVCFPPHLHAQDFDYEKLEKTQQEFSVVLDFKIELSFGMQTNEQEQRLLGTIVTEDGMVIFDGSILDFEHPYASFTGMTIKATPTKIEVTTLDGKTYEGEYLGVDRFTRIGFLKIVDADDEKFHPVRFARGQSFRTGEWFTLFFLLPKFVDPQLAADVGMLSQMITSPESFPLTVGFNEMQLASVIFNESSTPVGVLGMLTSASSATSDASGLLDSYGAYEMPMLGVITSERIEKLIADPPRKGKIDRAWLGITLQALTEDIAEFLDISSSGGIIVNDVVKGSPADVAGLIVGDVIYEVNGQPVGVDREERISVFQRLIAEMEPGSSVEFSVYRTAEAEPGELKLITTLQKAPMAATDAEEYEFEPLEFKVRDLVFSDYLMFNMDEENFSGVIVSELRRGGLASIGGLLLGDVIQRVDNIPITSHEDMKATMDQIEKDKPEEIIFFVWRNNKTLFVNVKTDW